MRRSIITCLLLVACATTGDDAIFLESDSYGCGAVEGLGCGLAIAPVLERIDQLEGVEESSVSWDGRHFRIAVGPDTDRVRVAAEAAALLEGDACCVMAPRGEAGRAPDRWFDASLLRQGQPHAALRYASLTPWAWQAARARRMS